jgi:uncharacterized protein
MRITVVAKPGSRTAAIKELAPNRYAVSVIERPEKGKANDAVRRALAKHLHIAPSRLSLVMGATAHVKVLEVRE